jgi:hypothetical protein
MAVDPKTLDFSPLSEFSVGTGPREREVAGANRPNFANPLCARFPYVRPHAIGGVPLGGSKRSSRPKPNGEKLICRYCGSDDLAPSFRTRRDARCRACFKKRYGSAARNQKAVRTRKVKAAK